MPQSKLRELLESLKARYPTASADELTEHFMEELRSDEELRKTALEEVFRTHGRRARASVAKKPVAHQRLSRRMTQSGLRQFGRHRQLTLRLPTTNLI